MTIKYAVREGHERGKGRYMGHSSTGFDWKDSLKDARKSSLSTSIRDAEYCQEMAGREVPYRVVPVTTKKVPRKVRITREQLVKAEEARDRRDWGGGGATAERIADMAAALTAIGFEVDND